MIREPIITKIKRSGFTEILDFLTFEDKDYYELGLNMKERKMIERQLKMIEENFDDEMIVIDNVN